MIKWLLVIGVVAAVYYMFIKKKDSLSGASANTCKKDPQSKTDEAVEEMVECSKCGVYVEIDEAILSNGKYYCSKECLKG